MTHRSRPSGRRVGIQVQRAEDGHRAHRKCPASATGGPACWRRPGLPGTPPRRSRTTCLEVARGTRARWHPAQASDGGDLLKQAVGPGAPRTQDLAGTLRGQSGQPVPAGEPANAAADGLTDDPDGGGGAGQPGEPVPGRRCCHLAPQHPRPGPARTEPRGRSERVASSLRSAR
jgi:hypothetical protein